MPATENTESHGDKLSKLIDEIRVLSEKLNAAAATVENRVRVAALPADIDRLRSEAVLPNSNQLLRFYALSDGFSLMDCFNGVAVHSAAHVTSDLSKTNTPQAISGRRCLCFGSTGGGDLFCVLSDGGEVVRLTEVAVKRGQTDPEEWQIRRVATDVLGFIVRVADDVTACLEERQGHEYLSSP